MRHIKEIQIMKKYIFIAVFLWASCVFSQEPENLDIIADNQKFDNAKQFISLGMPQKALVELTEYLEIYNRGIHRNEALSLLAKIYCDRFDYQRALKIYKKQFEEFSNSDEGIAAFFQIGICYSKMGYNAEAEDVFKRIIKEYPSSIYSGQSRVQLDLMDVLQN